MNETSNKLRIFIINMAAQSLGELQEAEIISKVNDTVENMLDLFFVGTHGLSRSSVANVPRLLLLCAFLPARRFVAWNALRLADDGDALDAVIDKLVVPILPQLRDGLVRQLFLQRFCIFNCHLESS